MNLGEPDHRLDPIDRQPFENLPGDLLGVEPSSALSTTACIGTHVPFTTQAPDTLPGIRSTSGHFDQSIGQPLSI
jgi:hypothetical protein